MVCQCYLPSGNLLLLKMTQSKQWIFPLKVVIFHSYVSLPEGTTYLEVSQLVFHLLHIWRFPKSWGGTPSYLPFHVRIFHQPSSYWVPPFKGHPHPHTAMAAFVFTERLSWLETLWNRNIVRQNHDCACSKEYIYIYYIHCVMYIYTYTAYMYIYIHTRNNPCYKMAVQELILQVSPYHAWPCRLTETYVKPFVVPCFGKSSHHIPILNVISQFLVLRCVKPSVC